MTRAASAILVLVTLAGCGDDSPADGGGGANGDDPWTVGPEGRTLDANACHAVPEPPEPIRCYAEPAAGRIALGLCGDLDADNTLDVAARSERDEDVLVAVDGASRIASPLHVQGGYVASGGLTSNNTTDVAGTFKVADTWSVSSPAHVGGDAIVAAHIEASSSIDIDGVLRTPFPENADAVTASESDFGDVDVGSPLECEEAIDIAALIASVLGEPGTAGTDRLPSDLLQHVDQPSSVELGCGNYIVSSIGADNTLDLHIVGSTVMVVTGDLRIAAPMTIDVAEGAILDLAIGGDLLIDNTLTIRGTTIAPAVWIGVAGEVHVAAPVVMDGVLVVPRGDVNADNTVDLSGAILARNLHVAAPVHVQDGAWLSGAGCVGAE